MVRSLAFDSRLLTCEISNVSLQEDAFACRQFVKASTLAVYAEDSIVLRKQIAGRFKSDPAACPGYDDQTLDRSRIHFATMMARTLSMTDFGVS